jgi:hypothetical protein
MMDDEGWRIVDGMGFCVGVYIYIQVITMGSTDFVTIYL